MKLPRFLVIASALLACFPSLSAGGAESGWRAGAAQIDITPDYPVRLSGYGNRTMENEGVLQHIHAKALALKWQDEDPVVLITVDNCGVPDFLRTEVLARLSKNGHAVEEERLSLHSSHTHCAPMLRGVLTMLFGQDVSPAEKAHIDQYTEELTVKIVTAVSEALDGLAPATVDWAQGDVKFAGNRRLKTPAGFSNSENPGGIVDHALPVLRVTGTDGKVRAIFTSYACHCTTLGLNQIHADWAGCAQEEMQKRFPGAIALTAIGCGADQNPYPRREIELAVKHGTELATEAQRVSSGAMKPLTGPITCAAKTVRLPFDTPRTRQEWETLAGSTNKWTSYHAKHFLAMLDEGKPVPDGLDYRVQAWSIGGGLTVINLPGEVVVDYGLRFKKTYGQDRTWVNSYTNDVPCYIPSQRVWEEGGYEGGGAMLYYGRPTRFASGIEEIIAKAVAEIAPKQ